MILNPLNKSDNILLNYSINIKLSRHKIPIQGEKFFFCEFTLPLTFSDFKEKRENQFLR